MISSDGASQTRCTTSICSASGICEAGTPAARFCMKALALMRGWRVGLYATRTARPDALSIRVTANFPSPDFSMLPLPNVQPVVNWMPSPKHVPPWWSPISTIAWSSFAPARSTPSSRMAASPSRTPAVLAQHLWPWKARAWFRMSMSSMRRPSGGQYTRTWEAELISRMNRPAATTSAFSTSWVVASIFRVARPSGQASSRPPSSR